VTDHSAKTECRYRAVVVGVSAGGLDALGTLLPSLPQTFPLPVLIVQHLLAGSGDYLAQSLDEKCALHVKEADEKEPIQPGRVYIAPANYHLLVERDETLSLSVNGSVHYSRPSIDVLFESAARVWGAAVIGVILTGASADGAEGMRMIARRGGLAVVQDPATAEQAVMPRAAIEAAGEKHVLPLAQIGPFLVRAACGTGERT